MRESGETPGFIGAWLDLAIEEELCRGPQVWTLENLCDRWAPEWSESMVRRWLERALELNILEPFEAGVWRLTPSLQSWELDLDGSPEPAQPGVDSVPADPSNRVEVGRNTISFDLRELPTTRQLERAYVNHVIKRCSDNKRRAARILRIDPSTLHRKLRRWERLDLANQHS